MIKFASNPKNVALVEGFIERMVEKHKLSPHKYGDILVSLTEAVNNAIIHGNGQDESKNVAIEFNRRDNALYIRVSDEGGGFDFRRLPNPTSPDHLMTCGGRGVYIMNELCDKLKFHNNGSTVEMRFKI